MSSEKQKPAEEEGGGESAPLWIISFADMISLLMAFFVMLSSFNSFDKKEKEKLFLTARMIVRECGGWLTEKPQASLSPGLGESDDVDDGPQKPPEEKTTKSGRISQTHSKKFATDRVFLIPEKFVFYSNGTAMTPDGRKWFDTLSVFLSKMPGRILIAGQNDSSAYAGSSRAVAAAEYLAGKKISSDRISVSVRGTVPDPQIQQDKMLEISLLEKDICP